MVRFNKSMRKKLTLKSNRHVFRRWLLWPALALFVFMLTQLAALFPEFTNQWYSQKVYPIIAGVFSNISSVFPFSLDDSFYILLITVFLALIFLLLFKKISFLKAINIILNTLAITFIAFYLFWGFNYFRSNLNQRLDIPEQTPDKAEFISELEKLIENTNNSYSSFEDFDQVKTDSLVEESYKKLAPALQISYPLGKRKAKKITLSGFFAKAGISGYYGPFFSEIHVNDKILPLEYPFVLAHEKAHQFGITSEAEANFYAWLVCTQSTSKQLQYSANLNILRFFLYQGYQLKEYPEIIAKLDDRVKTDFKKIRDHWDSMRNEKVDRIASQVNDAYLKSNKIEKGIEDYTGVVKFVMDYSQDKAYQEKWNLKTN